MSNDNDEGEPRGFSRRELLKRLGIAGVAAAVPFEIVVPRARASEAVAAATPTQEAFENLTTAESDILEAFVARLIPTDENGPGATEARAAHYIDRALGGALAGSRQAYAEGLAALDRHSVASRGASFTKLSVKDQDSVLSDVEAGTATPGTVAGSSTAFFSIVRSHTLQGTFGDPYYGGNANFVGWDLIGYPGVRIVVTPDDQRLGARPKPNHKSAYDYTMFNKAAARTASRGDQLHGD